jgi:hypothetical protein
VSSGIESDTDDPMWTVLHTYSNPDVWDVISVVYSAAYQERRIERQTAFMMSTHARIGEHSWLIHLDPALLRVVFDEADGDSVFDIR